MTPQFYINLCPQVIGLLSFHSAFFLHSIFFEDFTHRRLSPTPTACTQWYSLQMERCCHINILDNWITLWKIQISNESVQYTEPVQQNLKMRRNFSRYVKSPFQIILWLVHIVQTFTFDYPLSLSIIGPQPQELIFRVLQPLRRTLSHQFRYLTISPTLGNTSIYWQRYPRSEIDKPLWYSLRRPSHLTQIN